MGHAGTLTAQAAADADSKIEHLRRAGVVIASSAHLVGVTTREAVAKRAA